MSSKKAARFLTDIIEFIDRAQSYVGTGDFAVFDGDLKTILAVERCMQNMTEAAIRLGREDFERLVSGVDFATVRGLGNVLRHEYDKVDARSMFDLVIHDLPPLRAACQRALDNQ